MSDRWAPPVGDKERGGRRGPAGSQREKGGARGLNSSWAGLPEWAVGENGGSWAGAGQKAERSEGEEEILFYF